MTLAQPSVAELLVDTLISNGIDQLYCLPGVQNDPFFDALFDRTSELRPVHARHEQGAAYMALGAALATGRPQAFCVVPGPGFLNACAALSTAYAVGAPVLAIVGQIPSDAIGKGRGLLHEIPDQLSMLRGLTKQAERLASPADAPAVLQRSITALTSGRPRPVGIEIPTDLWRQPVPSAEPSPTIDEPLSPTLVRSQVDDAVQLLSQAQSPMIVVGGGAQRTSEHVTRLGDAISAPTVAFRNGHGVVSADNDLRIGMPVAHDLWPHVDLVIGLGTRLTTQQTQWGVDDALKILHIDIDAAELGRINQPTVGIHADLADALPALLGALGDQPPKPEWRATVAQAKARMRAHYQSELTEQLGWLNAIRSELPRNGIFVDELTQCGYVSRFAFESYAPRTFLSTGYQGTLGYGFATALGAAHARRDVPVVNITGDGGAMFTISELATAVHHQIPLTTVVFNDNAFGNVRRLQNDNYDQRFIASDLTSPDFVALAESFGAQGLRAVTPDELRHQLRQALASPGPTLIEVPMGEVASPWPFVLMPKVRG